MVIEKLKFESKNQIFKHLKNPAQDWHFQTVFVWIKKIAFSKSIAYFEKFWVGQTLCFMLRIIISWTWGRQALPFPQKASILTDKKKWPKKFNEVTLNCGRYYERNTHGLENYRGKIFFMWMSQEDFSGNVTF